MKNKIILSTVIIILILLGLFTSSQAKEIYAYNETEININHASTFKIDNKINNFKTSKYKQAIKYNVEKGKIKSAELCIKKEEKIYCLNNNDSFETNKTKIQSMFEDNECSYADEGNSYECIYNENLKIEVIKDFGLYSCVGPSPSDCDDSDSCRVTLEGEAYCHIW